MSTSLGSAPQLGGKVAIALFICILLCFVIESQLTQYVQTTLGYRQPYFLLYIIHGSFSIIFPLHFYGLVSFGKTSAADLWANLSDAVAEHLAPSNEADRDRPFPWTQYLRLSLFLTVGLTLPALLWFAAVSLAPLSDVTALWNASAFFTYIFTVKLFGLRWEPKRLLAVIVAVIGSIIVVYGGSTSASITKPRTGENPEQALVSATKFPTALLGDFLTLIASVGYGLYQVIYKKYGALPNDPEHESGREYEPIVAEDINDPEGLASETESTKETSPKAIPFGLHANLVTSTIGLMTLGIFWLPIPFLHFTGLETFALPPDLWTVASIAGIAVSGVGFNAGFMVLLGFWGPIITSVGNLLTIVLVFISDITFGAGLETLTIWGTIGCGLIVTAFGVLAYDTFTRR